MKNLYFILLLVNNVEQLKKEKNKKHKGNENGSLNRYIASETLTRSEIHM